MPLALGTDLKVTVPKLGDKKRILELSERNAKYFRQIPSLLVLFLKTAKQVKKIIVNLILKRLRAPMILRVWKRWFLDVIKDY